MMPFQRRVVITGMGMVSPLGNDVPSSWEAIRAGRSGAGPITKFSVDGYKTKIACEVKDFKPEDTIDRRHANRLDLFSQMAVVAAAEAMHGANIEGKVDPERMGVILGGSIGGFQTIEHSVMSIVKKGPRVNPFTIPKLIGNTAPAYIAILYQVFGPVYLLSTACASGTDAIGAAYRSILIEETDVVITGGVEACITRVGVAGFNALQALSTRHNDSPELASRPFDKHRDGFVLGEGSGILVIEELEHARRRGAHIYAEVIGSGMTCDAYHQTAPHVEGRGAIQAMRMALKQAGLEPESIDYINAHGTSTPLNDPIETSAIKSVFGDHAYRLKVSSTKSMHGHTISAAGGMEAIICALAIRDQYFPPTINLDEPDPECDLDYVPNRGVQGTINYTMSNSFGFGGHNGVLVLGKYRE